MNKPPSDAPPSPNLLKFFFENGLLDEAKDLERKHGLSTRLEEYLFKFITVDPEMKQLKDNVRKLATVDDTVLIQGETGTGKELLANALHYGRKGEFVAINCAGMPESLIESELFGYESGSFTGAKAGGADGLIKLADNGTLFLDEVGDLPLGMQAKLLRVIQEKRVRKVGGKQETVINTRFIAATHFNLSTHVEQGLFRRDLYARLSTFVLRIKPLRERVCDIPKIVEQLDTGGTFPLDKIDWTNFQLSLNVRELQQIVRRYQVLGELPI